MAFSSQLMPGEIIINDSSSADLERPPAGFGTGLDLSRRGPEGYAGVAEPFPQSLIIPESEWQALIQEMEQLKSRGSDLATQAGLPYKDQNGTSMCWINAPTYCVEVIRVIQNQPMVILSPASAGGPIKNWRDPGGWGKEGLEWIVAKGLVPVDKWPANAISQQYYTEENKLLALDYRVIEWWELRPRSKQELISCLLRRWPIAVGYNWWSHEVTAVDPVWVDGAAAIRIRNSWGNWGSNGYGLLQGSKMLPDDAVVPRTAIAS